MIEVNLGGYLAFFAPKRQSRFNIPINQPIELVTILQTLGVPVGEVALVSVNGEQVELATTRIKPGDRIELLSPMGGG